MAQDRFVVMQVFEYIYIHIFIHARRFLPDLTFFQNVGDIQLRNLVYGYVPFM